MDPKTLARVARGAWAMTLGLRPGRLDHVTGVTVIVDPPKLVDQGFAGHLVFLFDDACVITTSAQREGTLHQMVGNRSPAETFDPAFVASLAIDDWVVLGPSRHTYIDHAAFTPLDDDDRSRRLGPDDADAVERFRGTIDPADWGEGGFDHDADVRWGIEADGELVAMGNMTEFAGRPADVGLVTHPAHRGRGHGAALASAMTRAALDEVEVVRYRALESNTHSLRIASKLGFVPYGSNYAVRPAR